MGRHLSQKGSGRVRMRLRTCSPRHFFSLLIVSNYFLMALVPGAVQNGVVLKVMKSWLCPPGTCSGMGRNVLGVLPGQHCVSKCPAVTPTGVWSSLGMPGGQGALEGGDCKARP